MKTKALYFLVSVAMLSFASCTDEAQELAIDQLQTLKQIVMITQDFETEVGSRTLYQITEEAVTCTWAAHDTVGVFPDKGIQTCFPMASGAGTKNATFDGGGWALKDGNTYAAYYPFISEIFLDKNAVPVKYVGQTQTGNASVDHLGAYDYMVAMPTAPEFGSAQFTFKHLSALVQLRLTVPQPTKLSSVKLVADAEAFAVEGKVDIMAEAPVITPVTSTKEIVLNLQDVATTKENQVVTLYLMLPPVDLNGQTLKVLVSGNKGTEELAFEGKNFQAGKAYGLSSELKDTEQGYKDGVVSLAEAGTMKQLLGDDFLNITSLKIIGPINGDDVRCLHQMLGSNAFVEKGKLTSLDLSEASIVKGGSWYCKLNEDMLEEKFCYTSDDVISEYMFYNFTNLQNLVLPNNVTTIRYNAFKGSSSLTSLKIPDGVTSIGSGAFSGCSSLVSIDIPKDATITDSSGIFDGCSSLTSIELPDGLTFIGSGAFYNCSSLESIDIPNGVTSIDYHAFGDCLSLKSLLIPNSVTSIGEGAFWGCSSLASVNIPDGVTSIGWYAFYGCSSLISIDIPNSVTSSIGYRTFLGCSSLTTVTIGDGVTSIGNQAFSGCSSLTSITIGNGVISIGDNAFSGCSSLTSIVIPDSVISIGVEAFYNCSALTSVNIPDGVTSIGESTFYNCSSLSSIVIPDGVTSIGGRAFYNCSALSSVNIPDGVTSINSATFYNCSSLSTIDIPDGVTSIGGEAFYNCSSLTSINIPDGVTSISKETLYNCFSLLTINIGEGLTFIDSGVFHSCISLKSVHITDLSAWCKITFDNGSSNPLCNGAKLYLDNHELTELVIPEGVTEIKDNAFYNCPSITSVNIPDGVTSIGSWAFSKCSSLSSVTIGDGVRTMGKSAFKLCDMLHSVYITNLSAWCKIVFSDLYSNPLNNYRYGSNLYLNGKILVELIIPEDITEIKDYVFVGCHTIATVAMGDGVTMIGAHAFQDCDYLSSITIGNGVISIGDNAFFDCDGISSIAIGAGVITIGKGAFCSCETLTRYVCYPTTPPVIEGTLTDSNKDKRILHVPTGCSVKYEETSWKDYFTNIVEME